LPIPEFARLPAIESVALFPRTDITAANTNKVAGSIDQYETSLNLTPAQTRWLVDGATTDFNVLNSG
jgi:hypothetical protein